MDFFVLWKYIKRGFALKREMGENPLMWRDIDGGVYKLSHSQMKKWDDMILLLWIIAFLLLILIVVALIGWLDFSNIPTRVLDRLGL